ncbi:aldose 1-epimerase family protein [Pseudarthrobacter sp. fls2-241-R2A-127]|uniref:aldose 1-epimerase family protein n=1 Tax=Pseudarthrobacter sp. fls2-241-R2A-127 TaxID=3040303 RepID=UPI00255491DF|nr:aldose 1-epimerase family protein [Pseudarthrobacter sp. fls2-241-R2A-127]
MDALDAPVSEYAIRSGSYTATVSATGAILLNLQFGERDLVLPSRTGHPTPDYRGIIAAPWPNRIADGRYTFEGSALELPRNELARGNALHGLVFDKGWEPVLHEDTTVILETTVSASKGYPFSLQLTAEYRLTPEGLSITLAARNTGTSAAPYGACPHPYLVAGPTPLDQWILQFGAERFLAVTADRLLPTGERDVHGHAFDYRDPRPIGSTAMDHAFTGLAFDDSGRAGLTLWDPTGVGVGMSWDCSCPWLQLHTADRTPPLPTRLGLAVEPMSCPPDAFNSGKDLIRLLAGEEHRLSCSIFAL